MFAEIFLVMKVADSKGINQCLNVNNKQQIISKSFLKDADLIMRFKTQIDAVIEIMELSGGFASLQDLYSKVQFVSGVQWKTKTPEASIRRIVQESGHFFRIRPGLWALNKYKNRLPKHIEDLLDGKLIKKSSKSFHYYYQGIIVQLGNYLSYKTQPM